MKKCYDLLCFAQRKWKKPILIMKLTIAMLLLAVFVASASSVYSQTARINLKMRNVPLVDVFREIERSSEFGFFFKSEEMDLNKLVSIDLKEATIDQVLKKILVDNYDYRIVDKNIIITRSNVSDMEQQKSVTGKVSDPSGAPLPGVTVVIKGSTTGTITDAEGNFSLNNVPANATLSFSFVGMVSQDISVGAKNKINVVLQQETIGIEEVVAVGYGTMKKSDLTGSVSNIKSEKLLDKPAFNVAQAISGKVAGVKIIENNGAPGAGATVRIRGTNSISSGNTPLFVVDGVVGVQNALTTLNPNEIESMDVLKDASATAIYGARGANGVIIITTKRGISGKTQVEYNSYATVGVMNRHLEALDAEQFMYVYTQAWQNVRKYSSSPNWSACFDADILPAGYTGLTYSEMPWLFEKVGKGEYSVPLKGKDGNYYKPRFDTNWEKETFKPSFSNNQQINIRGGNDKAKFGAFFNYANEDGLLLNSYYRRYSGKLTGDVKVNRWFDFSANLTVNHSKNRTNDVSYFSGGMSRAATEAYPILPVKYPNDYSIYGSYAGIYGGNADFPAGETPHSPVAISDNVETFNNRDQYTGDITLNFKLTKDLSLKTNFAVDGNFYKYNNYGSLTISTSNSGSADINTQNTFYWQNESYFNYNKTIGVHSFSGMVGLSWSRYSWENLNTSNQYFFDDFYKWHNIGVGTATRPAPSSSDGENSLNSYFGRLNYSYKNKYLFTATGRMDGSSKFGTNSKYGFFPSGSFAWRISEEDFAKNIPILSNAKLRLSAGQTGNQEIGSYVTQNFISSTNVVMGGTVVSGLYPSSVGNADLKWEKTTQYNGGIDIGLYKDRVSLSIDYYNKRTTDMLLDVPLPTSTTTGSVKKNYGTVGNKGWEVSISTHNIKGTDFNWFTTLNFSANRNKIIKLGPTGADILKNYWVGGANTILREGQPIGSFFGLKRLGTYSTQEASLAARYGLQPGDVKYYDKNGDGAISFVSDGDIIGNAFPKWDADVTNNITYKNWDFSIDIKMSFGAKKENRTNHSSEDRQAMANGKTTILDAWRPDHQNTMIGQVRPGNGGAYYQTYPDTHWVENASYIRGEGATLGYTLPGSTMAKYGLQKVRFYANSKNFFLITKYTGYDPEGSDQDNMSDSLTPGMDFFMYPRPTTFTFGVNVTF